MALLCGKVTDRIIRGFYNVYNCLGPGFLEKVYEEALCHEFRTLNLDYVQQKPIHVYYNGTVVGHFVCDFLVENMVIVEVKAVSELLPVHDSQLINYLKATSKDVGLLLNFGLEPQIKRRVYSNQI